MTEKKVLVRRAGRADARTTLMDPKLARHLVALGRLEYATEPEGAAMQSRRTKVITRAPRPRPTRRVTKGPRAEAPEPQDPPELPPPADPEEGGEGPDWDEEGDPEEHAPKPDRRSR